MGVTSDIRSDGSMILYKLEKNQQIYLPRDSVVELTNLKDDVRSTIESNSENRWPLGDEKYHIYLQVSKFQGDILIHFRIWWKDQPTKQGITISVSEWHQLMQFLQLDDEATVGLSVLDNMLSAALGEAIKKECEGCSRNYLSQSDHPCMMDACSTANRHVDRLFDNLNVYEFITQLAQKAADNNVLVKRPVDTFNILRAMKESEIKLNALSQYRY